MDEIRSTVMSVDPTSLHLLVDELSRSSHVATYGVGREGLAMRAFAMRLHHLGIYDNVSVVGEMSASRLNRDDLLIVSVGPGFFSTVDALVQTALKANARVVCLTAQPSKITPSRCHLVIHIPAQTMVPQSTLPSAPTTTLSQPRSQQSQQARYDLTSVLPMGSAYEGAMFFILEVVVHQLRLHKEITEQTMRLRHTNLE